MPKEQKGGFSVGSLIGAATSLTGKASGTSSPSGASALASSVLGGVVQQQASAAQAAAETAAVNKALAESGLTAKESETMKGVISSSGGAGSFLTSVKEFFTITIPAFGAWIIGGLTFQEGATTFQKVAVWGVILAIVAGVAYYMLKRNGYFDDPKAQAKNAETVAGTLNAQVAKKEGFQVSPGPAARPTPTSGALGKFIDAQPLTIKHAGFLGPVPEGLFKAEDAVGNALRAGFRSFILQIDYLEKPTNPALYGKAGTPVLVFRDTTGALRSSNSATVDNIATTLAGLAFREGVPNHTTPIVLYLHIHRAPSAIRTPDEYLNYMSCIAKGLAPLAPFHLGMTPLGDFHRQNMEDDLLRSPLSFFAGQVIILCNADLSLFRNKQAATQRYLPADDLDYWVNMRVYLDNETKGFGLTSLPDSGTTAKAVIMDLEKTLALDESGRNSVALKNKSRYSIAMPSPMSNPTPADLQKVLNTGFNLVPLEIFTEPAKATQDRVSIYNNEAWHPKPVALQLPTQ